MAYNNIEEIALFEHRFWLQILGDHSRFILNALSPKEKEFVQEANEFICVFDELLERSRKPMSHENLQELNYKAYSAAMKIRKFKLSMLSRQIGGRIKINLPPDFLNLMTNEVENYLCVLSNLIKGKIPLGNDININLFWLEDGIGHADAVANGLDATQKELIKKSREYAKKFTDLYLEAKKYNGYTRTGICEFHALKKYNFDVDNIMSCFKKLLKELEVELSRKEVLGTIYPLMAEHMFREECYYLTKLSMVSEIDMPECNPAEPRIEG